jgi:transcriptional regulator with PAS, ATPase and Fis domain
VELLANFFLESLARAGSKQISLIEEDVLEVLDLYDYPGNVRELKNIIAEAVVVENGRTLTRRALPRYLVDAVSKSRVAQLPAGERKTLAEMEAEHIRRILELTGGNRTMAAQILGISRVGLLAKMKRYDIDIRTQSGTTPHGTKRTPLNRTEPH